jgi:hypothetical protein
MQEWRSRRHVSSSFSSSCSSIYCTECGSSSLRLLWLLKGHRTRCVRPMSAVSSEKSACACASKVLDLFEWPSATIQQALLAPANSLSCVRLPPALAHPAWFWKRGAHRLGLRNDCLGRDARRARHEEREEETRGEGKKRGGGEDTHMSEMFGQLIAHCKQGKQCLHAIPLSPWYIHVGVSSVQIVWWYIVCHSTPVSCSVLSLNHAHTPS